jgi:maltose phosphorylase
MNQDYILANPWSIVEEGFEPQRVRASESLFSLGNGNMGQRANFEEHYSGSTFQGSYLAGVYYPDKTKVGWWKNGYPEYFAKVLNAPSWIGIEVSVNGERLDLNRCTQVLNFRRELNMKEGWYERRFKVEMAHGTRVEVQVKRFLSLSHDSCGAIRYALRALGTAASFTLKPYLDAGIENEDTNWEEKFWEPMGAVVQGSQGFVTARTKKTHFTACTFMDNRLEYQGKFLHPLGAKVSDEQYAEVEYQVEGAQDEWVVLYKYGGYTSTRHHPELGLQSAAQTVLKEVVELGFDALLAMQRETWESIWDMADIVIEGDVKAQQGIRFNIFQLNQTYLGRDARLNIGPKGFTGEKYGGSTYWDTEAYCLPFYMATKNQEVARSLLEYRYRHLSKAIENAEKLGFTCGAALYPMVTMNGEECHNEWEITFEEIHRNGAIAFAIYNYVRYTGDNSYVPEMGLEVLIGIARFWRQRVNFSKEKNQYVILGVTGPNEYENNVNNNWYTNYTAQWCLRYAVEQCQEVSRAFPEDYKRIQEITGIGEGELKSMLEVADQMYFPYSEEHGVFLQQEGFLDKELVPAASLDPRHRPINQHWSWDRILRSPYIKQADVLQGFYFFEDHFSREMLEKHFAFYEPFTVHESSLSPCVHCVQAAALGRQEQAYAFYLRTSRLDLDDYNKEVHEGLHITSMAGTWMSVVEGFGGLRVREDKLSLSPTIPDQWTSYSFKINFRNHIVKVVVSRESLEVHQEGSGGLALLINGKEYLVEPGVSLMV